MLLRPNGPPDSARATPWGRGEVPPYTDFAVWQRAGHRRNARPSARYWRRQLAGIAAGARPPWRPPRPGARLPRRRPRARSLSPSFRPTSRSWAAARSTLFMTVFAPSRRSSAATPAGRTSSLGSPSANRHRPGTEGIIGFSSTTWSCGSTSAAIPASASCSPVARGRPKAPMRIRISVRAPGRRAGRRARQEPNALVRCCPGAVAPAEPLRLSGGLRPSRSTSHPPPRSFRSHESAADGSHGLPWRPSTAPIFFDAATIDRLLRHFSMLFAAPCESGAETLGLPPRSPPGRQRCLQR